MTNISAKYRTDSRTIVRLNSIKLGEIFLGKRWRVVGFSELKYRDAASEGGDWFVGTHLVSMDEYRQRIFHYFPVVFWPRLAYGTIIGADNSFAPENPISNCITDIATSPFNARVVKDLKYQVQYLFKEALGNTEESNRWIPPEQLVAWDLPESYCDQPFLHTTAHYQGLSVTLIVSCLELLRFYCCSSTKMLKAILNGLLDENRKDLVFVWERCSFDKAIGQVNVCLNRGFCWTDCCIVGARYICDPIARRAFQLVRGSYRLRHHGAEGAARAAECFAPSMTFPFEGASRLSVEGSFFKDRNLLFVHRIDSCTAALPYRTIICDIVGNNEGQLICELKNPPPKSNETKANFVVQDIGDKKRPISAKKKTSNVTSHVIVNMMERFAGLADVEIQYAAKTSRKTDQKRDVNVTENGSYTGSDRGTQKKDGATQVTGETKETPPLLPDEIDKAGAPLGRILVIAGRLQKAGYKVTFLDPVGTGLSNGTFVVESKLRKETNIRIQMCILRIEVVPVCYFYLMDMEAAKKNLSRYLMVWGSALHELKPDVVLQIVDSGTARNKWNTKLLKEQRLGVWLFNHRGSAEKTLPQECFTIQKRIKRVREGPVIL